VRACARARRTAVKSRPEAKCADASGKPCGKQTVGLLYRRHVTIDGFDYIGKESNKLEQVEEGGVTAESDVYTIYDDPGRDEWPAILAHLKAIPLTTLMEKTALSRRGLQMIRAGRIPNRRRREKLDRLLQIVKCAR
jgi:hypothetical protein